MSIKFKGVEALKAYLAHLPSELETKVLRGAARAAAKVIADEAKLRSISSAVAGAIKAGPTKIEGHKITATVQVKGDGSYLAPWLEYGTDPHIISLRREEDGRFVDSRRSAKNGSLVIGGQFVGAEVSHPGARPHPFLRPAMDANEAEAIAAAQSYISARIKPQGIIGTAESDDE